VRARSSDGQSNRLLSGRLGVRGPPGPSGLSRYSSLGARADPHARGSPQLTPGEHMVMRPSKVRSGARDADQRAVFSPIGEKPKWVLRSPYSMLTATSRLLQDAGPQSTESIARFLIQDSPLANRPNPRRKSGHSSAVQVLVTMGHLRLSTRNQDGMGVLTDLGHRFAGSIGTQEEAGVFRDILLATPCFAWFWGEIASVFPTLRRSNVLEMAEALYPEYNEETRKTLAGVCLNYARAAHLIRGIPGGRNYAVSHHQLPVALPRSIETLASAKPKSGESEEPTVQEIRTYDSLKEAGVLLGRLLAEDAQSREEMVKVRLRQALESAVQSRRQRREYSLVRVAAQLANKALESNDLEMIRLATLLVNGILDLDRVPPA
jgi:hypothetical protein